MPDLLDTRLQNRWMVYPNHANNLGTVHGGYITMWMDQLGAMSAMRFSGRTCVTARMDQVNFERPVDVGDITLIEAYVYAHGESSVRVRLRAAGENPRNGETVSTAESYAVFVAIDEDGKSVDIGRELTAESAEAKELRALALEGDDELSEPSE